ncbi:MAG TPA: hypothetical protein H9684_03135 [Firmicutes bacterium]|nr:hypothetical protein [Bacillota bacterium]
MKIRKNAGRAAAALLLGAVLCMQAAAGQPYTDYEYTTDNYNGMVTSDKDMANAKPAPAAFVYEDSLNSADLGLDVPLNTPEDFTCDEEGNVYIMDTLNGRIVMVGSDLAAARFVITGYTAEGGGGTFEGGRGLFEREGRLYVCLPTAKRIVAVDIPASLRGGGDIAGQEGMTVVSQEEGRPAEITLRASRIVDSPDLSAVKDSFDFKPTKLVADRSDRLYVVVEGVFDGLLTIDSDNEFIGFVGANRITMSALDLLWRSLSTDAQIEKQEDTVPVEFNSLTIDSEGFIYTTAKGNDSENLVRRLNLIGNDVLVRGASYIKGELSPLVEEGNPGSPSNLVDIDVIDGGIYTCLDNIRGKVFTYNSEGDLLFVFGGISAQRGAFNVPTAVEWNQGNILVLDKGNNELVVFRPTEYGSAVINATVTQYTGGYGASWELWDKVITLNPHNQVAHRNVGKLQYDQGNYQEAMEHFELGNSPELYSKAFAKQRKIDAEKVIPWVVGAVLSLLGVFLAVQAVLALRRSRERWRFFREEARKYKERNRNTTRK